MNRPDTATRQQMAVNVAGHEIKLEIEPEERLHIERAAAQVTERLRKISDKAGTASPGKMGAMVAFQFACDLSIANELLDDAAKLHEELKRQREAVKRLETLLARVDNALAY